VSLCKDIFDEFGCFTQCWSFFFSDREYFSQFQSWIAVSVPNLAFLKPNFLLFHSDIVSLARPLGLTDSGIFSRKHQRRPAPARSSPTCLRSLKNETGSQCVVATLEGAPYRVVKVDRNAQAGSAVRQYASRKPSFNARCTTQQLCGERAIGVASHREVTFGQRLRGLSSRMALPVASGELPQARWTMPRCDIRRTARARCEATSVMRWDWKGRFQRSGLLNKPDEFSPARKPAGTDSYGVTRSSADLRCLRYWNYCFLQT